MATDVDVCACMLCRCVVHVTHKSAFPPLHDKGIDAVGGAICSAARVDPKVSPGLGSCAVAAGSIHHNLTFSWRGAR